MIHVKGNFRTDRIQNCPFNHMIRHRSNPFSQRHVLSGATIKRFRLGHRFDMKPCMLTCSPLVQKPCGSQFKGLSSSHKQPLNVVWMKCKKTAPLLGDNAVKVHSCLVSVRGFEPSSFHEGDFHIRIFELHLFQRPRLRKSVSCSDLHHVTGFRAYGHLPCPSRLAPLSFSLTFVEINLRHANDRRIFKKLSNTLGCQRTTNQCKDCRKKKVTFDVHDSKLLASSTPSTERAPAFYSQGS